MTGKKYWRSLAEIENTAEYRAVVEREFPQQASEWIGDAENGGDGKTGSESRRTFLKIMGASVALAGLASCRRWPVEKLAPYAHKPANRSEGMPVHYATAYELGGLGIGVVATSVDGRPIKTDGNPTHPLNKGGSDYYLQASVLDVYDPYRSREVVSRNLKQLESLGYAASVNKDGAGLVVISEASRSPSVAAMRKLLPNAKWFEYEAFSDDNQRAGAKLAFGRPLRAVPDLKAAKVIVSLDADLFGGDPMMMKYGRDFADGRRLHDTAHAKAATMNRLYVVECGFTNTGSMADHRRGVTPAEVAQVAEALLTGDAGKVQAAELRTFVGKMMEDIKSSGAAVVVAGARQPKEVHAAVAQFNAAIKAPVAYYADPEDPRGEENWTTHGEEIKAAMDLLNGGTVETLLIIGCNPVYSVPGFAAALQKAKTSIHFGIYEDETGKLCTWHVPKAHYLEAWGDVRSFDGTVSITQPLIQPLFGAKSTIELLAELAGKPQAGYDIVRGVAKAEYLKGVFNEWAWKKALFNGVVENSARKPETVAAQGAVTLSSGKNAGLSLALYRGMAYDGRFANNGWLQELPDPLTRITWENALIVSPKTAAQLNIKNDFVYAVTANGQTVEATAYVLPGQADDVLGLAVGYGHTGLGYLADGVGVNAYSLAKPGEFVVGGVTLAATGKYNRLATVQDHNVIDKVSNARKEVLIPELVVEGTFKEFKDKPKLGTRNVVSLSMWNEHKYDRGTHPVGFDHRWGMAIDLTTCIGCGTCVVACQSENNIPIVGKEQVILGREMHWLRIDRYFKHQKDNPQAVHQPLMCVHCEMAPCEAVCPVAATTHSVEGINMMTYNRCIGTRYCSNNCPYKVRRFNFFDFNNGTKNTVYTPNIIREDLSDLLRMSKNPNVSVRSRGVMEKCTYCIQRIEAARIQVRKENRANPEKLRIGDGMVQTACQQSCPTNAIVFGDLNDKESRVSKLHAVAHSYKLLDPELNTKPRTVYLAKVRNPVDGLDGNLYENGGGETEGFYFEGHDDHAGHDHGDHKH